MLKITEQKGGGREGRRSKRKPCPMLGNYDARLLRCERKSERRWGWPRVTRSLLECLRRRLITQLRGFSRMLISRNTCKTRRAHPLPLPLFALHPRFPLEDPVVLEASWDEGLDCTRRLKRDQKEAAHVAEEISTYTLLHARELVCGTRTRVRREGRGGEEGATYARARLFRVPLGRRRGKERSLPTLGTRDAC